jgi:predicted unusual protein kinase regulating ubiquinone biosynthesis (AarF/ABC1/UbiB family)
MQYPFLRVQSKWDLIILKQLTSLCNYLGQQFKNTDFDFVKLFNEWTSTLVEELDFNIEVNNALKAKKNFSKSDKVYIP